MLHYQRNEPFELTCACNGFLAWSMAVVEPMFSVVVTVANYTREENEENETVLDIGVREIEEPT